MGFKRISPNSWARIKRGRTLGFTAFVIVFGIAGTLITAISATQTRVPWKIIIATCLLCLIISVVAAYVQGHAKMIPDSLIDDVCSDGSYTCTSCTTAALREACEMTKPYYGHEYVSGDIAEQWRLKNPKAFMQILNSEGEICASFGILALKDSFMDQFIDGKLSDGQLTEKDVLDLDESKKVSRLYLSGVIVRDPSTYCGSKRARVMMWAILVYLKEFYGLRRNRTLFAVAVTKESGRLMKNLNFELIGKAKHRVDQSDMYKYDLTRNSWESLLSRIGDFSKMFKCKF